MYQLLQLRYASRGRGTWLKKGPLYLSLINLSNLVTHPKFRILGPIRSIDRCHSNAGISLQRYIDPRHIWTYMWNQFQFRSCKTLLHCQFPGENKGLKSFKISILCVPMLFSARENQMSMFYCPNNAHSEVSKPTILRSKPLGPSLPVLIFLSAFSAKFFFQS